MVLGAIEIREEHVVPELIPPWPRLDLREVHPTLGELVEDAHERARGLVIEAPEDHRGLVRRPVWRRPDPREPYEAGEVVGAVLDPLREYRPLVELGGKPRADGCERLGRGHGAPDSLGGRRSHLGARARQP